MIEAKQLTKKFGTTVALNGITFTIGNGSVFGLVGSNGAGKSTFLRTAAGVYKPDEGSLLVDGFSPYSHIPTRERLFFISDFPYFPPQASLSDMFSFYQRLYPGWDRSLCKKLCGLFPLDSRQKIIAMSKGMQRQAALICALSTRPSLLLLDEIFDGLDPVIRQLLRQLLADGVAASGMGVVIASHNLRELEDVCDHVGLFHKGGVVLDQDLDELKLNICRVQAVFPSLPEDAFLGLDIIKKDTLGSLITMVIRGDRQKTEEKLRALQPIFLETLPLTLEEVFISEMEAAGYDIDNILS
jgi:ABC-2 type transport system ATP-binding protein